MKKLLLLILLILTACNANSSHPRKYSEIRGRNHIPVYRAVIPSSWTRQDPDPQQSLTDTTKPITELFIIEGNEKLRISIHNFPSDTLEQRIPPTAQVLRWKKQFTKLDSVNTQLVPQAYSGYSGFLLEASGTINGKPQSLLAWAMQLAPEHYRVLTLPNDLAREMRSDYTIKAQGTPAMMSKHREEIISFARSFELIHPIKSDDL